MRFVQRQLWVARLLLFAATSLLVMPPSFAQQKFPTKPVRFVIGFTAGGPPDTTARIIGPKLADMWGQPVVIENRVGASGTLAVAVVAQATPDGHTLALVSAAFAVNAVVQPNLPFDPLKDFRGVTQIGVPTSAIVVAPSLGVRSLKGLIAAARERPGKLIYATPGPGSSTFMTTAGFNMLAGITATHVAFKGQSEMMVEILGGRVHYGVLGFQTALSSIKDGRLLALAVVTAKRSPLMPDVPTVAEILPGYDREAAHALLAPARTPNAIVQQISKDVARVLDIPDVRDRFQALGFALVPTTPEEHDRIILGQIEIFTRIAKVTGIVAK
jgi:tripartite-type tricarboxylate transporter receptor subunit TctC